MTKICFCSLADREHARSRRQYAHTYHRPDVICFARAVDELTDAQYWAILAHEVGHLLVGYEGTERDANRAANAFFGVKILYRDSPQGEHLETASKRDVAKIRNWFQRRGVGRVYARV